MARSTDDPQLEIVYDIKHAQDQRLTKLEHDLLSVSYASELNYKLLCQSRENDNKIFNDKLDKLVESIEKMQPIVNKILVDVQNNKTFADKIMTIWKVLVLVSSVLAVIVGGIYTVSKDTGVVQHHTKERLKDIHN